MVDDGGRSADAGRGPRERQVPPGYVDDLFRMDGIVATVTGGGSGLGEAIATGYAQAGARVAVADVNLVGAEELAALVTDVAQPLVPLRVDVSSRASVDDLVAEVMGRFGRIDVLVNAAGVATRGPADTFPEEEWDRMIAVNLKGSFLMAQACGRVMLAQASGSIINLASIGGMAGYPQSTGYQQSKGGVVQLTRSLAVEWADRGVRVNAIAPSLFDTPLVRRADSLVGATSSFIMDRTPIGRRGQPREIVGAAIFLASRASSMVTGHILAVDGGYLAA
jgi:NAD(P)-dependent dehydrogenase (short-subunit alcohol dehydrogenase family)